MLPQCKWLTFEAELHAIVLGCAKFGGFITTATVKYPPGGPPKLLILSDSTTALGKWKKISLPDGATCQKLLEVSVILLPCSLGLITL